MTHSSDLLPRVVPPSGGDLLRAFGDELTIKLAGADTGGRFTMLLDVVPPGGGPPPHYHRNEDEWFYPLEGRVEFLQDDRWSEVPAGSAVFMPRGSVHSFRNTGDGPLKLLIHAAPSGIEFFFERCAQEFAKSATPDAQMITDIAAKHGIVILQA